MNEEQEDAELIVKRAVFGKQVEQFLNSDIGRYMVQRATLRAESAVESFKRCDPSDVAQVRKLQNEILWAESFSDWLSAAVTDGLQALNIIEERE